MIREYAREYVAAFNKLQPLLPDSPYSKQIIEARIFLANDSAVIFYIPEDFAEVSPNFLPQGRGGFLPLNRGDISLSPPNDQPLTIVLQAATYNCLKVGVRPDRNFGEPPYAGLQQPPDLDKSEVYCSGSLNPLWLNSSRPLAEDSSLTIVGVAPSVVVTGGKLGRELPTHRHVFSPLLRMLDGSHVLQHTWSFADVLFWPSQLDLSASKALKHAEAACWAVGFAANAGMFGKQFSEQPIETSSSHLLRICDEFEVLLNATDISEKDVQAFLEKGDHRFLLQPAALRIDARRAIGGMRYVPDFICHCANGDFHLIEIEDPAREIYQQVGGEQAAHLTHAISQVQDWLRYIGDNRDSVEREDGLRGVYKPTGEVIAGRDSHLNESAKRRFDWARTEPSRIAIRTYDMLIRESRAFASNIAKFGS